MMVHVFEWDSSLSNATETRAAIISGAPTASRHMVVSTPDRHLVFFGTETTIGDASTQDDMFIRFSDQEDINTYTHHSNQYSWYTKTGRRITDQRSNQRS